MASVDWKKLKTGVSTKAMFRHDDMDKRLKSKHANVHIDKRRTPLNWQACDYEKACDRFDDRIKYLDEHGNANKRKDRLLCVGLEVPLPEKLPASSNIAWVKRVLSIMYDFCGKENVVGAYYHVDEVHEYKHTGKNEYVMSREHIHLYAVPEVDGQLNGKAFMSRSRMKKINKLIHNMSLKEFGVEFMDGSQMKSLESVETLKFKSRAAELDDRERKLNDRDRQQNARETSLNDRERDLREYDRYLAQQAKKLKSGALTLQNDRQEFENDRQEFEMERKRRRAKLDDQEREITKRDQESLELYAKMDMYRKAKIPENFVKMLQDIQKQQQFREDDEKRQDQPKF